METKQVNDFDFINNLLKDDVKIQQNQNWEKIKTAFPILNKTACVNVCYEIGVDPYDTVFRKAIIDSVDEFTIVKNVIETTSGIKTAANWVKVQYILLRGSSHEGRVSCVEKCKQLGVNPHSDNWEKEKKEVKEDGTLFTN